MNLLRTRPQPELESRPAEPGDAIDVDALAAAVDTAATAGPDDRSPVMLVSRRPPLLLLAIPQDAPSLPEILANRTFSVTLGERTAACHLHSTADGGETAVLVGDVVAFER